MPIARSRALLLFAAATTAALALATPAAAAATSFSSASSSAAARKLLDHDVASFRAIEDGGAHNALDPARDVDDQTRATTCLPRDDFVRANGALFELGGKPFAFAGWNQWEVLEAASDAPPPFRHLPLPGREHVVRLMNEAVENGLKVVRMWAHTITEGHAIQVRRDDGPGPVSSRQNFFDDSRRNRKNPLNTTDRPPPPPQSAPGVWNEDILRGMDFVMDQARARGLKIIWALADNWDPVGGIDQYVEWSPTASRHRDFFTDALAIRFFRDSFETIANRVNTYNGIAYKDDATIMAWNLANEARCQRCDSSVMQARYVSHWSPYDRVRVVNAVP
jgi:mannan endo-1,4-beta-mannosidase